MNMLKKVIILTIIILITSILFIPYNLKALSLTEIMDGAKTFLDNDEAQQEVFNAQNSINTIYYAGLGIGIVIAFVVGIVIAIQLITSGVEGQAKVKEKLIPYCVGCFVVFGAFGIWRLVYNILQSTFE